MRREMKNKRNNESISFKERRSASGGDKDRLLIFKGRTAVFIDAANIERSLADLGTKPPKFKKWPKGLSWKSFPRGYWGVDYKKLYRFFKQNTKLVSINFYSARFDTRDHDSFLAFLKRNGYRLITKPIKRIKTEAGQHRKANFDVEISVDAVSQVNNYRTLVLFSGDSDFGYLLGFLKSQGKKTVVISQRGHVSKELVGATDVYLDIYKLRNQILRAKTQKSRG